MNASQPPTLWTESDTDIDEIAPAIERWHAKHGLTISQDAFVGARVLQHPDEQIGGAPYTEHADVCRVVLTSGSVYDLDIEYDADLRGESWHQSIEFVVTSGEVLQ